MDRSGASDQRGQATVELALVLPVVVLLALAVAQVAVVAVDAVLVHHAAREAARAAAVDPQTAVAVDAARGSAGLSSDRLAVDLAGGRTAGDTLTVTVVYTAATDVPLVGRLVGDVTLRSGVSIRVE
jgi:Flp pilus assembly protein TadG